MTQLINDWFRAAFTWMKSLGRNCSCTSNSGSR